MKSGILVCCLAVSVLNGCAYLGPQSYKHVIEDKTGVENPSQTDGRIGTFALVAERRMVLVKFSDGRFCAEPPPDAVDNLSASLSAALSADTKSVGASASAAAAVASYAKQLFYRSQGLQLYRDGLFALCAQQLNGAITAGEMKTLMGDLLKTSADLIKTEIPELKNIKADTGGTPPVPNVPSLPTPPTPPTPGAVTQPSAK